MLSEKYLARVEKAFPFEIKKTDEFSLYNAAGKSCIDFTSGWCVGNIGWGNSEIRKALANNGRPDYVAPPFYYQPWEKLAAKLAEIAPGELKKVYRTTGGTESVDGAMQIAMASTGRKGFMSVEGSYHGNSIATLSIGDSENRDNFKNLMPDCYKIEPPLDRYAIKKVETKLKKKNIAAFIMEPVITNLAVTIPEPEFMAALSELCNKYGTLLVMDEVATGFGRTGRMFASEHYDIKPDIMCLGKAITGGYAGMGAILTTSKIAKRVKGNIHLYSTYGWHPASVDAAIANLNFLQKNRSRLLKNVTVMEALCNRRLAEMKFKGGDIRSKGLAISVDVKKSFYAFKIALSCFNKGLIISPDENHIVLFPPITVTEEVTNRAFDILQDTL